MHIIQGQVCLLLFVTGCLQVLVIQHLSEELSALQQPPRDPRNLNSDQPLLDEAQEKWRDRSAAFGLLLSVANIDPKERPEWIKKEEVNYYLYSITCNVKLLFHLFAGSKVTF